MACKRGVRFFASKKGMDIELMFNVFELVVVFMAATILYDMINGEADASTFEKNYFARDSALLLNTIYASPGDVEYKYTEKTGNFILDFKQNKVDVYEQHELIEGGVVNYPFAEDRTYSLTYKKIQQKKDESIIYKKSQNSIGIS